eukprot:CAMPEP_0168717824 /NCGR_PEP_ID=MMETSP0724-20121128/197_1 /TAXON_ID=265536 /ORGANISM="Amphiprora sp., Strain CCMP467" /LENGTH=520 /DNA_ID=CAMNT_0008764309 /DNA_START=64 /DNA_END=1627 /DNA_ORIENTATION=+
METVFDVPSGLPQCHVYKTSPRAYVRDCYPEYYDYIKESMDSGKHYVVVTGTPGIGKSVFYLYFFDQHRAEHPGQRIVVASYSDEKELQGCKEWDPAKKDQLEVKDSLPMYESNTLYLIDGVPNKVPNASCFAVFFTSPDIKWFIRMNKHLELYREIYMPNWTSKEIFVANETLNLQITRELLNDRWQYFGGAPRFAFVSDQDSIDRAILNVRTAMDSLESVEDVFRCFNGTADPQKMLHRLMHYDVRQMRGVFDRRLKLASNYIAYEIQEKLNQSLDADRKKLMMWLALWGYAHEKLLEGVELPMKGLNAQAIATWFKLDKTAGNYTKFKMADMERVFEDAYRQPDSSTLRSVDAYYMSNSGVLWLFQMTRDINHKINVEGLLELLEKFNKLQDTENVNLIFVVPMDVAPHFPAQEYKLLDVFRPDLSDADVERLDCTCIPGIQGAKKRKLNDAGISTIGDVMAAKKNSPSQVSFIRSILTDFKANRERNKNRQKVLELKQYCISLDYGPRDVARDGNV